MNSDRLQTYKGDILVVDDTLNNLRLLSSILTERGYKVRKVLNGEMALTAVQAAAPDLILLDIKMPEMNGYEVCQHLKADVKTCEIPVIFISALDDVLDKVKAFSVGGVDYITKPFQVEEVLARIENQLAVRSLSKQLIEQNARLQQEIRDRIRAEETLCVFMREAARSAAELRALFAAMNELIFVCDASGTYLKIVPTNQSLLYKPVDELLGKTLHEVFEQSQADTFLSYIQQSLETRQTVNCEYSLRIREQEVWFASSISPISEESVIWVARDMTERKQAENALWEKEQLLRLVLDNIPQQIFWKDTNLVFLGCNKNWAKSAQLESPDAVVGLTDYDLLPNQEIAEQYRKRDRQVMETNTPESHVIESKQKISADGKPVWFDVSRIPIHDLQGKVIGVLGTLDDITLRKQAEEALLAEQEKSERLLLNILPSAIADQLKQAPSLLEKSNGEALIAEQFNEATILFADIVSFTSLASRMSPKELVNMLNQIFSTFDQLAEQHGLEKIKTIGDAYMV
ncbi:MAG TPA: PAS domain-containing protein, partial [Oculatellaceae cyanobacterium]